MINSFINILVVALAIMPLAGCGKGKSDSADISAIENSDSVPVGVKKFVKVVADGDEKEFAAIVSYPLSRPYPLKDIRNPREMEKYYKVMVDDSLKKVVTHSGPKRWGNRGWRGWGLEDGKYVWIDDSVYEVPYMSVREKALRDSLSAADIRSIEKSLRKGWQPALCLKGEDGSVYRIDVGPAKRGESVYRLAIYSPEADLAAIPSSLLTGYRDMEGTASVTVYYFKGDDALQVVYVADISGDSTPQLEFNYPDGRQSYLPVKPVYWLDLIPVGTAIMDTESREDSVVSRHENVK